MALLDQQTGEEFPVSQVIISHRKEDGTLDFLSTIVRDLREQKQAEEERAALQEQVIAAQRDALREISTPLIPLTHEILLMPLIGAMDTQRAQQMVEVLLEGVASYQADIAIVDITGIQVLDTQVANALMQAAKAVKLLGANIVLTGIGPTMAQTLIHLGTDLSIIVTRGSLQSGIEYAFSQTAAGGDGRWRQLSR
jgi:anti-anti-sigma regulatory factor